MNTRSYIIFLWVVFMSIQPVESTLGSGMQHDANFSVDFDDIPISSALSQLSRMSRIKISTSSPIEVKVKKSFRNEPIGEIIRELLNGFNYASLWSEKEDGVESITIWVFEKNIAQAPDRSLPPIEPNLPPSDIPPPPPDRPQIPGRPTLQRQAEESSFQDSGTPTESEPESSETEEKKPQPTESAGAVEVQSVVDTSQAQQMDLRKGDIIVEYGGVKINRAADLVMESKKKTPEEEVEVLVLRQGEPVRLSAKGGFIGVRIKTVNKPTESAETQGR